ncbi:MAG: biotin--[acetyl-CoA-carboxylase] ligase [Lactococcus plantarum]|nr:biotin--[acetyl-CoA-carboxylase] ligase [Lactococcus plantarum]MDN6084354.1 biotin--[acetyl-CoA-carboxylase] ligase [Lactococcus plantarum]
MTISTAETILTLLVERENEWISGQELAAQLNISRAAIWKAITKLINDGFIIESQRGPGKGYRYVPTEKMSEAGILHHLKHQIPVKVFDCLTSTNTYAKQELINEQITEPTVIIANVQTKGTGHFGRSFDSPAQTGLYMSIALPLNRETVLKPSLLTAAIAVSVARALEALFDIKLDFKWCNNLYYHNRKIGGILTEANVNLESQVYSDLVVGIGLNLTNTQTELGFITDQLDISRNQIAASLIDHFLNIYETYQTDKTFLTEYRRRLLDLGQYIDIQHAQQTLTGKALSITDDAMMLLETSDGIVTLNAGESK